jgi:hypothetical protein
MPAPSDSSLVCTNLRLMNGKRPIFADNHESVFIFPLGLIRFVEIHPGSDDSVVAEAAPAEAAGPSGRRRSSGEVPQLPPPSQPLEPAAATEPEGDIEIDEDFLRRVRDA